MNESTTVQETVIKPFEDREKFVNDSKDFFDVARETMAISDNVGMTAVAERMKSIKAFVKETEKSCRPRIKQVQDLKQSLLDDMNAIIEPAKKAVSIYSALLVDYDNKLEEERRKKRQEEERERIKEQARLREEEEKRKLETATELEKSGHKEEADQVLEQPDRTQPKAENKAAKIEEVKPEGVHFRRTWKAEMIAVDIDEVDDRFVKKVFDQDMANAYAKSNKQGAKAKGIRFYEEKVAVNR